MRLTPALFVRLAAGMLAAIAFIPGVAQAQASIPASSIFRTGQQLFELCTSKSQDEVSRCDSFLIGAQGTVSYLQDIGEIDKAICVPAGTTAEALRGVAVDYWRANPNSRKFSAVSSFWNALAARYPAPCS